MSIPRLHPVAMALATLATLATAPALALIIPSSARVLTTVSSHGRVLVEFDGMRQVECDQTISQLQFTEPDAGVAATSFSVQAVGGCRYLLTPDFDLVPGTYCLSNGGPNASVLLSNACMEVTGIDAILEDAVLEFSEALTLVTLEPFEPSCTPCLDRDVSTCTRITQGYRLQLTVENVATELASTHIFAVVQSTGPVPTDTSIPIGAVWSSWDSTLRDEATLPLANSQEESCVEVYARPFAGGKAASIGRNCLPASDLEKTLPSKFRDQSRACDPTFGTRWCEDNQADCSGLPVDSPPTCEGYLVLCEFESILDWCRDNHSLCSGQTVGAPRICASYFLLGCETKLASVADAGPHDVGLDGGMLVEADVETDLVDGFQTTPPSPAASAGCGCRIALKNTRSGPGTTHCLLGLLATLLTSQRLRKRR